MERKKFQGHILRTILVVLVLIFVVFMIVPFLIPIPPLENTVSPEKLADPDSKFVTIKKIKVHYKREGEGDTTLIFLHGFGASTFTWSKVLEPLSEKYTVVAYDRTGFGYTSRPMSGEFNGQSPYSQESQADQAVALMDRLGIEKAVLIGSSAGGTIATLVTLEQQERVKALILVDPAIFRGGPPYWLVSIIQFPPIKRLGALLVRKYYITALERATRFAWHDPSKQTPELLEGYRKPLRANNWDRALWEFALAYHPLNLEKRLSNIKVPVLVVTGDDDRIIPKEDSVKVAGKIPSAELEIISDSGHLPHEEKPEEFLKAVNVFLEEIL